MYWHLSISANAKAHLPLSNLDDEDFRNVADDDGLIFLST